jgi:hypothetical protein
MGEAMAMDKWTPLHPYLVIVRAGSRSLHALWLHPPDERGFDVLVSTFDDDMEAPRQPGVFFERRKGQKVAAYSELLEQHHDFLSKYRFIAMFDDDLKTNASDLQQCFAIADSYDLKISQPSLSHDSHFTFAALLQNTSFKLRFVTYVEMMCPIFRRDALNEIRPLYSLGFESGIDLIWCNLGSPGPTDFAVIDAVAVTHTRPVGVQKSMNGFRDGEEYEDHIYSILRRFSLPWIGCVPYGAITRDGRRVKGRVRFLLSALKLAGAVFRQSPARERARAVLVHWKHIALQRPNNIPVDLRSADIKRAASPLT